MIPCFFGNGFIVRSFPVRVLPPNIIFRGLFFNNKFIFRRAAGEDAGIDRDGPGISYNTLKKFKTFNMDIAYRKNRVDLITGMEVRMADLIKASGLKGLMLRGGMYLHEITEGLDFSFGAGYIWNIKNHALRVDYAFKYPMSSVSGTFGTHFLTTSFTFNRPKSPSEKLNAFLQ